MNRSNVALDRHPFLLVADSHADPEALNASLANAPLVRYRCFLGDALGYGGNPNGVLDTLSQFDVCIAGNHDLLAQGKLPSSSHDQSLEKKAKEQFDSLTTNNQAVLRGFVPTYARKNIILFHGSPSDPTQYLFNDTDVRQLMRDNPGYDLFIGGHLHIPRIAQFNNASGEVTFPEINPGFSRHTLDLEKNRYLINCPSSVWGRFQSQSGICAIHHESDKVKIANFVFN